MFLSCLVVFVGRLLCISLQMLYVTNTNFWILIGIICLSMIVWILVFHFKAFVGYYWRRWHWYHCAFIVDKSSKISRKLAKVLLEKYTKYLHFSFSFWICLCLTSSLLQAVWAHRLHVSWLHLSGVLVVTCSLPCFAAEIVVFHHDWNRSNS